MNYQQALEYIHAINWTFCKPGLERINTLCEKLGHPERDIRFVHVAGTNGKGSFCSMLSSILGEAGYKTGLYTSPHMVSFNERMRINNVPIDDQVLADITTRVRQSDADTLLFVGDFNDTSGKETGNTFFIREKLGDVTCLTRLYCHDGYLYELFAPDGMDFDPADGEQILPLNELTFRLEGNLIFAEIEYADGFCETLVLHLRSEKEVFP